MGGKKIPYSQKELEWVKANCTLIIGELHRAFCKQFGRTDVSASNLQAVRKRNGWKTGRTGRFEIGNIPLPTARPKGPNATSFKKGHVPANEKPLYSERIRGDGWVEIKIPEKNPWTNATTRYRLKHLWLWENAHGEIPENFVVSFKDGDKNNCQLSNLELLPRGVNGMIKRPKFRKLPSELKPIVKNIALLKHRTKTMEERINNHD